MTIKQLTHFVTVYEQCSFTQASRKLFISQQGISNSIRDLEHDLGTALFIRKNNILSPTPCADYLYQRALPLLGEFNRLETDIKRQFSPETTFQIATAPGILRSIPIDILLSFQHSHPQTTVTIEHLDDMSCERKVKSGDIDLALSINSDRISGVSIRLIHSEPYFFILPRSHPLAGKTALTLDDISGCSFVCFDQTYRLHDNFIRICEDAGFSPNIIYTSNEVTTLAKFALASNSLFLCVEHIVKELQLDNLFYLPFATDKKWEIVALTSKTNLSNPTTPQFIRYLCSRLQEVSRTDTKSLPQH